MSMFKKSRDLENELDEQDQRPVALVELAYVPDVSVVWLYRFLVRLTLALILWFVTIGLPITFVIVLIRAVLR